MSEETASTNGSQGATTVGNYFISNYPPYSFWTPDGVPAVEAALQRADPNPPPLGLYAHLPFCRKRCDFCYFKVYTDKNSSQVRRYLDGLLTELDNYKDLPFMAGRLPEFVYFGGGTPSYLSSSQLQFLFDGLRERVSWDNVREVAFECEPGTIQAGKAQLLKDLGVTRLSLGIENFNADVLELNNRAHRADEIDLAFGFARDAGFDQINIDLIAGMVGETDANWTKCIEQTIAMAPESVTIYQMEVPYNTTIYKEMRGSESGVAPVADWDTKRRWVAEAYEQLEAAGYRVGSAYTMYRGDGVQFLYRDALWHGADLLSLGVSSFSHVGGVHFQNEHNFDQYLQRVEAGERPITRAFAMDDDQRFIREFILQLKLGVLDTRYFDEKFGVDVAARYASELGRYAAQGMLTLDNGTIRTTRAGLLQIDRLLPEFFLDEHKDARYA